jgi:hypothetical protein
MEYSSGNPDDGPAGLLRRPAPQLWQWNFTMDKHTPLNNTSSKQSSSSAPTVLTEEQAKQIAGGLAAAVASVTGRCCTTCGLGGPYQSAV